MPIAAGSRLGPYEVLGPLGAGGMGEVYRATDTRLGRQVAIKVLPEAVAADAEMRSRFEREARAVAALSHPGICTLHDVGREGAVSFLVMELLEGETLAARLARGALSLDQVFRIGAAIADALAAAHERGIVHRDLKPANVMLTRGGVKLLDFGLAHALETPDDGSGHVGIATASVRVDVTQAGAVMGTVPYMAPEQLEGRRADARADIFALGAVLHEMATGVRAFPGNSQATVISAILTSQPAPVSSLRPVSPSGLDHLVRACLAKDPRERWQSARDVVLELRAIEASGTAAPPRAGAHPWIGWAVAALALMLLGAALLRKGPGAPPPRVAFALAPPAGGRFSTGPESMAIAVSPDGRTLAYAASGAGGPLRLWLRDLGEPEGRALAGTEGARAPFWSPDGRTVGFTADGHVKRVDMAGGTPLVLCDVPGSAIAASWGKSGILFSASSFDERRQRQIFRVPAGGGTPVVETEGDPARGEQRLGWPTFLPDGERFLFLLRKQDYSWHLMLAGPGEPAHELSELASAVAPVAKDALLYARDGALLAQRFDARAGRLVGEPSSLAEHVRYFLSTAGAALAASAAGTLVYQSRGDTTRLAWFDRSGRETGRIGSPGDYLTVSMADDGRVLFDRGRPDTGSYDVWAWDPGLQVETRITSHPEVEVFPHWLPGGRIVFSANLRAQLPQLVVRDLATGQDHEALPSGGGFRIAEDVSPDGTTLIYAERTGSRRQDLWAMSLTGAAEPRPLVNGDADESGGRLSPDGHTLAFISNESGRPEAYVMPYPGPGEKRRISPAGAQLVRWRRDGREIVLASGDGGIWSVPVTRSSPFAAGTPVVLFTTPRPWQSLELSPDGQRMLAVVPETSGNELPATVITGWAPVAAAP